MPEESLENELRELVKEEVSSAIPPVVFPDVQKVEVTNFPEQVTPVVNVEAPIVNVDAPIVNVPEANVSVTVDNSEVAKEIASLKDALPKAAIDRTDDILEALDSQGERLAKAYAAVKVIGGNASGAQNLWNTSGAIINPATTEKQDAIITAIEAIPGGGGVQYTEGDTDASITGTAVMWEDGANTLVAASAAKPLPVSATIDTTGLALAANQLPDGHNVTVDNASIAVTGTFWQATQPVSVATVPAHDVTNAGTFAVQVTSAPSTTVTATNLDVRDLTSTDVVTVTGGVGQAADVKVTLDGESVPVTGTFWQATQPVSGTVTASAQPGVDIGDVTINNASGASAVNIQDGGNTITVDGTVSANATLSAETTKVIGTVNVSTGQTITDVPTTSGGLSKFHLVGAATTNQTNVKASAGQVYAITAFNVAATPAYLKFHNTSGTPTAGSGVTDTFLIPGNTAGAGLVINFDKGIAFSTGIAITLVTGIADADTTAIAASNVVVNIYYK